MTALRVLATSNPKKPKLRKWIRLKKNLNEPKNPYMLLYPEGRVLLNDVAYEILHLCDGTREVPDVIHALSDKYRDVSSEDVYKFIDDATDNIWFDPPPAR
jgi:pyrroloquinoline quinone biosynthesis protein D